MEIFCSVAKKLGRMNASVSLTCWSVEGNFDSPYLFMKAKRVQFTLNPSRANHPSNPQLSYPAGRQPRPEISGWRLLHWFSECQYLHYVLPLLLMEKGLLNNYLGGKKPRRALVISIIKFWINYFECHRQEKKQDNYCSPIEMNFNFLPYPRNIWN